MKIAFSSLSLVLMTFMATGICSAQPRSAGGVVVEDSDGKPMEFISVYFKNTASGCITDYNGEFFVKDPSGADTLVVEAIGYERQFIRLESQVTTGLVVRLRQESIELAGAVVKPKKEKYRKKDNPAVELIRNVIARKDSNRVESSGYYSCTLYEKLTLSLDDFTPDFDKKKRLGYLKEYIDTSSVTGKPVLMVSIRETMNDYYYRRSPEARKTVRRAQRHVGLDKEFDHNGGLTSSLEMLFTGADIFNNDVSFMMNRFVSPISSALATAYYKYYIMDTVQVNGSPCIDLAFVPFNVKSYGFTGRLYITADGNYSIKKVQLNFPSNSNINWIDRLRIDQEFEQTEDGLWALVREDSYVNVTAFEGVQGIFAHQTRCFSDYMTDSTELAQSPVFRIDGPLDVLPDSMSYDEIYWDSQRSLPLDRKESAVAQVSDDIARKSSAMVWLRVLDALVSEWVPSSGSKPTSKFDFGPVMSFVGYDYIEGLRLRVGGMTTANLSKRWFGNGYMAYGFNDRKLKGRITLIHSFNDKHYHPGERPLNNLSVTYSYDIYSPEEIGEQHDLVTSLKTGAVKKLQYIRRINMTYEKQWFNSLRTSFWLENVRYTPAWLPGPRGEGTLKYEMLAADGALTGVPYITSTELGTQIVWAPGEKLYNSVSRIANMDKDTPVFTLKHTVGIPWMWGDYYYHKTEFSLTKRFRLSIAGMLDTKLKVGKVWNPVPWPLLSLPAANQSFSYRRETFHTMRALEFVTDQYVQLNLTWHMKGLIFNQIPLLKHLKLREMLMFNGVYGSLTEKNDPLRSRSAGLLLLPENTRPLGSMPYMEVGVGIENIFRIFRVMYFYRLTYRDDSMSWMEKWGGFRFGIYADF